MVTVIDNGNRSHVTMLSLEFAHRGHANAAELFRENDIMKRFVAESGLTYGQLDMCYAVGYTRERR